MDGGGTSPPESSVETAPLESPYKSLGGPGRIWNALRYSMRGLVHAVRVESAAHTGWLPMSAQRINRHGSGRISGWVSLLALQQLCQPLASRPSAPLTPGSAPGQSRDKGGVGHCIQYDNAGAQYFALLRGSRPMGGIEAQGKNSSTLGASHRDTAAKAVPITVAASTSLG